MSHRSSSSPRDGASPAATLCGAALLVLLTALFFHGVLGGGRFYALDFHQTFQPLRGLLGEALRQGSALWSPRLGNGVVLLANPLYAAAYPLNLCFAFLDSAAALTWLTVFHVLLGALGVWRLGRVWDLGLPGAWTAAVLFGFGGAAASATAFANLCWTQAWLPWLILAWHAATAEEARHRIAAVAGLALVAALMLSLADPFVLGAGLLALALLSASETFRRGGGPRGGLAALWGPPLVSLLLALLLVSPFLLAFRAYAPASMRAMGFTSEGVLLWSLHPARALDALLPLPFGDPGLEGAEGYWARATVPEKGFPLLASLYVGSLALALATLGALRRWRWRAAMLALLALLILLALGRHGPLYPRLTGLPFFSALRFPVKWVLPALLPLALLAGSGVRAVEEGGADGVSRRRALILFLLVAALLATLSVAASAGLDGWLIALVAPDAGPVRLGQELLRAIRGGFVLAVGRASIPLLLGAGLVWAAGRRAPGWAAVLLAGLVGFDLGLANARLAPTTPATFYTDVPPAVRALRDGTERPARVWVEDPWAASVRLAPPPRSFAERFRWQRQVLMGYVGAAYGLDLAFPKDTEQFAPVAYTRLRVIAESAPPREKLMLFGAAGVTHLVAFSLVEDPPLERLAVLPGRSDPPQVVWRNPLAVPRARLVGTLLPYEGDAGFIEAVGSHPDDLFLRAALVDVAELRAHGLAREELPAPAWEGAPSIPGEVRVVEDRGGLLRLRTRGAEGFLVVSDVWLPGWKARVDGEPAPLLRADYAFRAVPLPAGEHDVQMRYRIW